MTNTADAHTGSNKGVGTDMHRGSIQNHTVIIDECQTVGMNIESIIAAESGKHKSVRMTCTE